MGHPRRALCVRFKGWFYFLIITRVFIPAHAPPNHSVLIRASAKLFFSAEWPLTVTAPCLYLAALRLSVDWKALLAEINVIFKRINFFIGLSYAEQISVHILPMRTERGAKNNTTCLFWGCKKKKLALQGGKREQENPRRPLFFPPSACGWMNELICSHCASWIYSHALLWYPTSMGYCKLMTSSVKAHLHEIWTV